MTKFNNQYLSLIDRILTSGDKVENERTGQICHSVYDVEFVYSKDDGLPIITSRPINHAAALAELTGYLKGFSSAADFRRLGTKTWDANANENKAWLANPYRKGEDDMGRVYGVQGRGWKMLNKPIYFYVDQLAKIIKNLSQGIDDRGEIITYWNPGEFPLGCLRPCLYEYHFTIQYGKLHLRAQQRSCDAPLGLGFNSIQVFAFHQLMCQITGLEQGGARHCIDNAHVYDNQIPAMKELLDRGYQPEKKVELKINPAIKTLNDIDYNLETSDFRVIGYEPLDKLNTVIPFSV